MTINLVIILLFNKNIANTDDNYFLNNQPFKQNKTVNNV